MDLPLDKVEMIMKGQKHVINNTLSISGSTSFHLLPLDRALALGIASSAAFSGGGGFGGGGGEVVS